MAFLDEREIDDWFEEEKQALSDRLYDRLRRGDGRAKAEFDKAFERLLARLDHECAALETRQRRHEQFSRPFDRFRAWRASVAARFRRWWKGVSERRKKRTFEREYKRLFKHG